MLGPMGPIGEGDCVSICKYLYLCKYLQVVDGSVSLGAVCLDPARWRSCQLLVIVLIGLRQFIRAGSR